MNRLSDQITEIKETLASRNKEIKNLKQELAGHKKLNTALEKENTKRGPELNLDTYVQKSQDHTAKCLEIMGKAMGQFAPNNGGGVFKD